MVDEPVPDSAHVATNAIEESAVLVGSRQGQTWYGVLRRWRKGQPASVDFDWDWVLEREEDHGDVLGFFHTHPAGLTQPSSRDVRTMCAWVSSFGKPMICVIASGQAIAAYLFTSDEDDGQRLAGVRMRGDRIDLESVQE